MVSFGLLGSKDQGQAFRKGSRLISLGWQGVAGEPQVMLPSSAFICLSCLPLPSPAFPCLLPSSPFPCLHLPSPLFPCPPLPSSPFLRRVCHAKLLIWSPNISTLGWTQPESWRINLNTGNSLCSLSLLSYCNAALEGSAAGGRVAICPKSILDTGPEYTVGAKVIAVFCIIEISRLILEYIPKSMWLRHASF